MKTIGLLLLLGLVPIWRGCGHSRHDGISLYQLMLESRGDRLTSYIHIPASEAILRAHDAWVRSET